MSSLARLILLTTLLRLGFAWAIGLGVDESYMVAAGRTLGLGYFDHPPAAWWLSWAAAHLAGTEAPIVVRLPFILLFALSTWLLARVTTLVADERAGFWAAVLLNLSPVFGVTTGSWVLPDGPLDAALLGAALCLLHALPGLDQASARATGRAAILRTGRPTDPPSDQPTDRPWRWWAGAGICAGLALASKYSAVLTIAGAFAYLLASPVHRAWLRRPQPYLAALLAALVFAPVILWNATHGWASFAFQGERAVGLRFNPLAPFVTLGGEALFVLPWIWLPMLLLAWTALRAHPRDWRRVLLCSLAAPPILAFALIAAWSRQRILFHWAAPGYLMLFPLLGAAIPPRLHQPWVRRSIGATAALLLLTVTVIATQERLDWLGPRLAPLLRKDPTAEGIDWTSLRDDLTARGLLSPGTLVGVANWRDGGKIGYGLGPAVTTIVLNRDARQFGITHPAAAYQGRDMLLLIVDHPDQVTRELAPLFERLTPLPPTAVRLHDRVLLPVTVLQASNLRAIP